MGDWPVHGQPAAPVVITPWTALYPELLTIAATSAMTTSNAWFSANTAMFLPFVIQSPFTIARMFVRNGTAVSGNLDIGVYDPAGQRLVSTGSTLQAGVSTTQYVDVADTVLNPGTYYMGLVFDNTTATISRGTSTTTSALWQGIGVLQMASAFPLPATATFAAFSTVFLAMFGLSSRTF